MTSNNHVRGRGGLLPLTKGGGVNKVQASLSYYKSIAVELHGYSSKAATLMDHFIMKYGAEALPDKTPAEVMYLIMNIDHAGFGRLDEELFFDSKSNVFELFPEGIEGEQEAKASTVKAKQYQDYFRLALGFAVSIGVVGMSVNHVVFDVLTVGLLAVTVGCYHSYKHEERIDNETIEHKHQAI
jgi:hypothetical protein